jgi:hypothetical protein
LLLQIADSAAVDQPTLTPISFRPTNPCASCSGSGSYAHAPR